MRRDKAQVASFTGQLLFASLGGDTLTLDCVLARPGRTAGSPVTLETKLAPDTCVPDLAFTILSKFAEDCCPIDVFISDGRYGTEVEIISGSRRVLLQPDE